MWSLPSCYKQDSLKQRITNNPDATEEINFVRTELVQMGELIQTSLLQNGNGVTWKRLVDKAENEKNLLSNHLDGKTQFTGMMRLYYNRPFCHD
jgi:hypothetical protein